MFESEHTPTHLHRSRSTTSVKERKKHPLPAHPLDPETSRVHALIAAHRAMDRSHSRSSVEIVRTDSNASWRTAGVGRAHNVHFSPATQLREQRSALQTKAPHLSAALKSVSASQIEDPYVDIAATDFGGPTENYGSEPSSYRRIRRAKSMLTPRRRLFSNPQSPAPTPLSQAPTLRTAASSGELAQPGLVLRLKKSLTFLRPASRVSALCRPETHLGHTNEAIRLARNQYLEEERTQRKPSLLFRPKVRQPQKAFRKSVRSSHLRDTDDSTTSDLTILGTPQLYLAKRSFSATLRERFMKAFGRSMSSKHSLPPQQLEATRQHFGDLDAAVPSSSFDSYQINPDDERRESFYVPSRPEYEDDEERDRLSPTLHTAGSRESLHSNARSRVTSWTNSTMTTSTVRGTALERNRLSIIKEDGGPHQPSSSAGRHIGGISVFQTPLETEDEGGYPYPAVDSQRIYSALMKRIGEEEAEMGHTAAALEEIHQRQFRNCDPLNMAKSTIRAVSSTTAATEAMEGHDNDICDDVDQNPSAMTPEMQKQNFERRKAKLASPSQEDQSSFYPFSEQSKPLTPSPFRKLLEQRRSGTGSEVQPTTLAEVSNRPQSLHRTLTRGRFALSSESVYSRTTDGGENPDHVPPVGSTEYLAPINQEFDEDTGMVTIIPARPRPSERLKLPSADSNEKREWKGWIEGEIDASLGRRDSSKTGFHFREHAQVDPEDVRLGKDETIRPHSKASAANRFPLLDVKEVPRNTLAPRRSSSLTKSQSGLSKRASTLGLKPERSDENNKIRNGFRKLSPANLGTMLRERKIQMLAVRADDADKENKPATSNESPKSSTPPMSTPGRLGLQMRSGNGRLRKRASDMAVRPSQKYQVTPKNVSTPLQSKEGQCEESPTDRVKQSLSARLSRPFNMDVPEPNRPFDSMYLGKQDINLGGGRLSTAPNTMKRSRGYGGLGGNPFDKDREDTALPEMQAPDSQRDEGDGGKPGGKIGWSSKRMVSDFLKKRRIGRGGSGSGESGQPLVTEEGRSPAYV